MSETSNRPDWGEKRSRESQSNGGATIFRTATSHCARATQGQGTWQGPSSRFPNKEASDIIAGEIFCLCMLATSNVTRIDLNLQATSAM
jgi:hypothetical protein